METYIALLRGINVGGHNKIKMADLKDLCLSLELKSPRTLLQSGNLVFLAKKTEPAALGKRLEDGIQKQFGFRCRVLILEVAELRRIVRAVPFDLNTHDPKQLLVVFLDSAPKAAEKRALVAACTGPEEPIFARGTLYVHYPEGAGNSKFTLKLIEKTLKVTGSARNWNTTSKLLALSEADPA